jgi:hypothetical protein
LKENIVTMGDRLDDLLKIKVRTFDWKNPNKTIKAGVGFVAQELVTHVPEAVQVGKDDVYTAEEAAASETVSEGQLTEPWSVNRELIIPMMVKSIQELSAKVTTLENA